MKGYKEFRESLGKSVRIESNSDIIEFIRAKFPDILNDDIKESPDPKYQDQVLLSQLVIFLCRIISPSYRIQK